MFFRYINGSSILEFIILRLHSLSPGWISPSLGSETFPGSSARFTRVSETFGPVQDQIPNLGRGLATRWGAAWTHLGHVRDAPGPRFWNFSGSFLGFFEGFKLDLQGLLFDSKSKTLILPKS